jgi:arginyl-tRNA synthetase
LKALAACNGDDPEYNVDVLIGQMVKIMEGGEEVKLSKRAGTIITLEELVEKVGVDAARYTLIRYPVDTPMVMDVDILRSRTNENPVYYVQYAHARINSIIKNATENNILMDEKIVIKNLAQLLNTKEDLVMIKTIFNYTDVLKVCVRDLSSHHISGYLLDLAGKFHNYYAKHKIVDKENIELSSARILLCKNIAYVLKDGLYVLGVSAPENM